MEKYTLNSAQEYLSHFPAENNEDASAEMIGSIILIGVFVAAFGIILVMLLSAPSEFVVPAVVIEANIVETDIIAENDTYVLNLRSGDTLEKNETRILVDGIDRTEDFTSGTDGSEWSYWGSGDSLTLDLAGNDLPESVQIIYYDSDGNGILLWDVGTSATVIPPTGLTPQAAFATDVTSGASPLSVQFTDRSTNEPNSWEWSFGDGQISSEQNPVHTYTAPGIYTVQLTAHNPDGSGTISKSGYIQVSGGVSVNFTAIPLSGTAPLLVHFTDLTFGPPTSWNWSFGDGNISSLQNPAHLYVTPGLYAVSLTAANSGSSATEVKEGYIEVTNISSGQPPEVSFTANPVTGDAPLNVRFNSTVSGSAPFTYLWTFGDGTTSTDQNPVHTYASAGTYDVSLTVTNAYGTDTATKADFVAVNPATPLLDIVLITDPGKPGHIENGGVFTFSVNGLYSFVEIDSTMISLSSGDTVEIRVDDGAQAHLNMTAASISTFNLNDATLLVNNVERGDGQITGIWISSYSSFDSTADLIVPKKNVRTSLMVDGIPIIDGKDNQVIRLNAIQPGSSGVMNLNLMGSDVYYLGGAEGYLVSN